MDHRPRIVVVEDEATQRQLPVDYLDKQNFRVSAAETAARCGGWWNANCRRWCCEWSI